MLLSEMTWPQVKQLDVANMIVVLPTGSFEQHGPHLPFTVDTDLVTAVARGIEAEIPSKVLLLPTLWPGMSTHHNAFPGTLDDVSLADWLSFSDFKGDGGSPLFSSSLSGAIGDGKSLPKTTTYTLRVTGRFWLDMSSQPVVSPASVLAVK